MDEKNSLLLSMYLDFRKHIDCICFENLKKMAGKDFFEISHNNQTVGFLMIMNGYIDAIYVLPEFRRLGIAKKAVLDAWNNGVKMETLHIVNGNFVAERFWKSIFKLSLQNKCLADSLYYIIGLVDGIR